MVNQDYLRGMAFGQDTTCPRAVNRLEKTEGHEKWPDYWVSVTLTEDGSETLYGIVNFFGYETSAATNSYQYIKEHRFFNGPMTEELFERFLDRKAKWNHTTLFVYRFDYYEGDKQITKHIAAANLDAAIGFFNTFYGMPNAVAFRRIREATTVEMFAVGSEGGPLPLTTE